MKDTNLSTNDKIQPNRVKESQVKKEGQNLNWKAKTVKYLGVGFLAAGALMGDGVGGAAVSRRHGSDLSISGKHDQTWHSPEVSSPTPSVLDQFRPTLTQSTSERVLTTIAPPSSDLYQSIRDTPSRLLEKGDSKRKEAPELSKEEKVIHSFVNSLKGNKEALRSLKPFVDSLRQNKAAQQGLIEVGNDPDAIKGLANLLENENFKAYALSESKNQVDLDNALALLESKVTASMLKDKSLIEEVKHSLQKGDMEGSQPAKRSLDSNDCIELYKNYTDFTHLKYKECCDDEAGTPHCDTDAKYDGRYIAAWVLPFALPASAGLIFAYKKELSNLGRKLRNTVTEGFRNRETQTVENIELPESSRRPDDTNPTT